MSNEKNSKYAAYDASERLGYLNIGITVPSAKDPNEEVLASPFLGTEVKAEVHPVKQRYMTEAENALWQAIIRKLDEMEEGETVELPLTVQLHKPKAKASVNVDSTDVEAMYEFISKPK